MTCEYCGNTSGKMGTYGTCISCGAPLSKSPSDVTLTESYHGESGGWQRTWTYLGKPITHMFDFYSINEIRGMYGLPTIDMDGLLKEYGKFGI